ncbi:oligopeptidase family protein [Grosmannia clavigera kw1407]|uniref:Dipeptidyl-peptidase V n=1 Tax=Grosmannia clavigera (strain kw1407 / UAMH 11150) TaxID=655863 RepID=F0XQI4_GROCL|nr:oligopeptidase family protein [Grosmannia clavigera kw1407]EFX00442.1 oligopeptidase family protein [Grosmannia clavigera kw1407]
MLDSSIFVLMDPSTKQLHPLFSATKGGATLGLRSSQLSDLPLYAEQEYVVVAVNPTGSTGFGKAFTDDIQGAWGGRPYGDVVNCFEHVKRTMPYADLSRAAAIGASYGGYLINWIAGQPLAKEFRALVCHDGVISGYGMFGSNIGCDVAKTMRCMPWEV